MTVLVRRPAASKAAARPRAGTEAPAAQTSGADGDQEDRTFVLPRAALLLSVDEGEPTVHRLAAITGMGRLDDNQLQIARAGVSRHHAVIEGTPDGFRLKDLGSQNGTFLNGERVTERVLADGDRILIGDAKLVFHSPWPKPGTSPQRGT
jgi:pSer/pThr/pTyr-binding forkhead associated (FHA) protein